MTYKMSKQKNDITFVTKQMTNTRRVNLGSWVNVGSWFEKAETAVISHFLDHILFKGTDKFSNQEIIDKLAEKGISHNAETSYNHTAYYFESLLDDFELPLNILSDILSRPTFDKKEF